MKRLLAITAVALLPFSPLPAPARHIPGIDTAVLNNLRSRIDTFTRKFLDTLIAQPLFSLFERPRAVRGFDPYSTVTRREELGLQHGYFADYSGQAWNVYALNDTIIALTLISKWNAAQMQTPQRIIYNPTAWEDWYAGIDSLYGTIDSLPIDSASRKDYAILTSLSEYYYIGSGCGRVNATLPGYCAAGRLFCRKDITTLRHVLRSPNLEGRIYALLALKVLDRGKEGGVDERLWLFQRNLSQLKGAVYICNGCNMNAGTIGEAVHAHVPFTQRQIDRCPDGGCAK